MRCQLPRVALGLVLIAVLLSAGCGPGKYDVSGKVTYNGAPIDKHEGEISFVGPSGELVIAPIAPDGTYKANNVSGGLNRVTVSYLNPKAKKDNNKPKLKSGETPPPPPSPFLTPEAYGNAETSGLSVTVDKITVYDVQMTGPPIP